MPDAQIPQIDVRAVDEDAVILDVRQPNEFEAGHAPGAVSIPLGQLRARVAEVPEVEGSLLVICKAGGRSQAAAEFLASLGMDAAHRSLGLVFLGYPKDGAIPKSTRLPLDQRVTFHS